MEIVLSIIFVLMRLLDFITTPIFNYWYRSGKKYLPSLKSDLLRISATELAKKIREKEISSVEVCETYIDRIKEVNPILNAVVEERFRHALKEAKQVDSYLNTTSLGIKELAKIKPLLGVPITIKESCSVKGMSLTGGLQCRAGYKAETDGETVAKLRTCGAIILLVSATPEICVSWECCSTINGRTNNPYDTTCTSAGSSGGEGSLLGAGASLIGLGSDLAGSIRLPAAFNGVFGHKPSPRVISIKGHFPCVSDEKINDFLVLGPLTRYATDLKLMMNVMCGSKLSTELRLNEPVNLSQLNVFSAEDLKFNFKMPHVCEDIKHAIRKSVNHLKTKCGATVKDYKFQDFKKATEISSSSVFSLKDIPNAIKWENSTLSVELVKFLFGKSNFTFNLLYFYTLELLYSKVVGDYSSQNQLLKTLIADKLSDNGIIILPVATGPAHKHNQMFFKNGYVYLTLPNTLGLPSTSIPCGLDKNGMPLSIQVMAGPHQDRLCLTVAEELENLFGGWTPPPEKE